jgi:DnaJ-class molecular chaperone
MRNPYEILSLPTTASEADVKKSFRRLAKQYHPDRKSEDPRAKERFNEITHAYDILGDATKRAKFDRGEIDAEGKPKHPGFEGFGQGGSPRGGNTRGFSGDFFSDIFGGFSSQKGRSQGGFNINDFEDDDFPPQNTSQSLDVSTKVSISLEDIANGGNVRVSLPNGKDIDVKIPVGVQNGQTIRLRGQGHKTARQAGDVLLTLNFASHPIFKIEENDLTQKLDIPLADAVLGGKIRIPTLTGEIEMSLPAWTNGGRVFRLRGKGLPTKSGAGDLLVTLNISLSKDDKELETLFRKRRDFTV